MRSLPPITRTRPLGRRVAVCSQRATVSEIVARLAKEDGVELPDPMRDKKASVWALSFDDGRLVAAEYFRPPDV